MSKFKLEKSYLLLIYQKVICCFFILFILLFFFLASGVYSKNPPKFLVLHLDAVSSRYFFQYMEEGYLPHVKDFFEKGHIIKQGLSLFPGGTETIYPRLKEGLGNEEGESVGWGYFDREKSRIVSDFETFSYLFSYLPRRGRVSFIYGIPCLDVFMYLPMINIPQLLETYGVIELIWFATDATGHALGEKAYINSIRRFDKYFGKLINLLNTDEINFILYCDHGMSFDNEIYIDHIREIKRVVGEELQAFLFPNLYLKEASLKEYFAQKIIQETEIDFAFYKDNNNPHLVIGYSLWSKVIFEENEEGKIRYLFEGEDYFNYYKDGYQGEWLTDLEWLSLTKESKFPAVPPNIFRILSNEKAGDIVLVVNPPKIIQTKLGYSANHHGVTDTDLLIPILLRGKELEHLYHKEEMWLHTLFTSIPALNFDNIEPNRESNSFSFWGRVSKENEAGFQLSLSPAYRWNITLRYEGEIYKGWFEYDVFSSYVIRLWTGVGLQHMCEEYNWQPFFNTHLQMDFGKIQFNYGGQVNFDNLSDWQENRKEIIYQINDRLSLNWQIPNRFGLTLQW